MQFYNIMKHLILGLFLSLAVATCSVAQNIYTFAGTGGYGNAGDGGPATAATIENVFCVVTDASRSVYFTSGNKIRKVDSNGIITTFAGVETAGFSGDGSAATAAHFNTPAGLAFDAAGNLIVTDMGNHRIRKISTAGIVTTIAGIATAGYSGDFGLATAAVLNAPFGLAIDGSGNIFFSDTANQVVREISNTGIISTVAGTGIAGYTGDGVPATTSPLNEPCGLAINSYGSLYIADYNNGFVRLLSGGNIYGVAGNGSIGYYGEYATASSAPVGNVRGVYADPGNNLYIAEGGNYRVQEIVGGVYDWLVTRAGNGTMGHTGDGGLATSAEIGNVTSITKDNQNNFYLADADNFRIRWIPCGGVPIVQSITGSVPFCQGTTISLADSTYVTSYPMSPYGYTSSNTAIATVSTGSWGNGTVTGVSGGTATITYTQTNSCGSAYYTVQVTVNPLPNPGTITGSPMLCVGVPHTLTDSIPGGVWSCATGLANIDSFTGIVSGVAPGITTISYTDTNACGASTATTPVTVYGAVPTASAISGGGSVCIGTGISLTSATTGGIGVWTSSNPSIAYAAVASGIVAGMSQGNAIITYTVVNGCGTATQTLGITVPRRNLTNGTIKTIAGNGTVGFSGDGGMGYNAELQAPQQIAHDRFGNTYIADPGNYCVRKLHPSGIISTFYNSSYNPWGLAVDTAGNVYVAERYNVPLINQIIKITPDGASSVFVPTTYTLSGIEGLCTDKKGNLYISNTEYHCVMKVTPDGTMTTFAGVLGSSGSVGDGGPATAAYLNFPYGVSSDNIGNIYIADMENMVVRKVDTNGIISTVAGTLGTYGYSGDGGPATAATFAWVYDVNVDSLNEMFISTNDNYVRKVDLNTGIITTVAGTGTAIYYGEDVPATVASMNNLFLSSDSKGNLYIVDNGNLRVREVYAGNISPITGIDSVCSGAHITLVDTTLSGSGTWSISDASLATVNSSGVVFGIASGSVIVSYTLTDTCGSGTTFKAINIKDIPAPPAIIGPSIVCIGTYTTLADSMSGGIWTSSNPLAAAVSGISGLVHGSSVGATTVTYSVSNACGTGQVSLPLTVETLPLVGVITGGDSVCLGGALSLSDTSLGGFWLTTDPIIATVEYATGIVHGVGVGTVSLSYYVSNVCGVGVMNTDVVVKPLPSVAPITGDILPCPGNFYQLFAEPIGGTWTSSDTAVATIDASGVAFNRGVGQTIFTYALTNACGTTTVADTARNIGVGNNVSVSGPLSDLAGVTVGYKANISGGIWSLKDTSIAKIVGIYGDSIQIMGVYPKFGIDTLFYTTLPCLYTAAYPIQIFSEGLVPTVSANSGNLLVCPNPTSGNFKVTVPGAGVLRLSANDGVVLKYYAAKEGDNDFSMPENIATGMYVLTFYSADGIQQRSKLVYIGK
jgi:sugar lactone lactonase YvrE/uncharacterized protein YjdB